MSNTLDDSEDFRFLAKVEDSERIRGAQWHVLIGHTYKHTCEFVRLLILAL